MTEEKIRKIVKRYQIISTLWLFAFIVFAIFLNWHLLKSNIDRHYELGVEYVSGEQGYIWGALIFGLFTLLHLVLGVNGPHQHAGSPEDDDGDDSNINNSSID